MLMLGLEREEEVAIVVACGSKELGKELGERVLMCIGYCIRWAGNQFLPSRLLMRETVTPIGYSSTF